MELREEEQELIQACLTGDEESWNRLFDRFYAPTARFVWRVSASFREEDVQEICQETFLVVVKQLDRFEGRSGLGTWICRIALNRSRDFLESRLAQKRGGGALHLPLHGGAADAGESLGSQAVDMKARHPARGMEGEERAQLLEEVLQELGDPCREILELRYFGDLSYEEISALLNLNPKTVSSRLSKCLSKLSHLARPKFLEAFGTLFPSDER